jgi:hypothetical protein
VDADLAERSERPKPLVSNRAIEDAAIRWVMRLEEAAGRRPVDCRQRPRYPGDIASPPRVIEVKAYGKSNRGMFLWLEVAQVEAARADPNFCLYIVENVAQGDPEKFSLKVLRGERLAALLERAKERRYFEVPWPVAAYDGAPGVEEL